jgi:ATP-binding cassette, subfamily B, bacterial MsbA
LALACLVGLLEAVSPLLFGGVFDTLLNSGSDRLPISIFGFELDFAVIGGRTLLVLLIAVTILKAVAEYGSVSAMAWLGQAVVRDLRNDVFDRILHQPLQFFHENPTGELISRVSTDIERVQTAASETLAEFLKQSATLLFLSITVFIIDWKLSLLSLVLVPLVFYPTVWFGRKLRTLSRSNQQELAVMANAIHEAVSGNRIVKAFLMEDAENRRFQGITQRLFSTNLKQRMTHALSSPMMEIVGIFAVAGLVLYANAQITSGQMRAGMLLGFIYALVKLYDAIRRMSGINNSFQQATGASSRIFEILNMVPERDTGTTQLRRFAQEIDFKAVHFEYQTGLPVLHDVSFQVRCGEVVALVGASGAGKTTLVNLVPRFYDVLKGSISIDGVDIRNCTLQSLRSQIAMVTQDVILFDDTVWGNLAYGNPQASSDEVVAAARAAMVDDFVSTLPLKYETPIGERGLRLSGGERQRISIARALLKNAPILILDEATSSLDSESEVYVQRALQNLMEGRTTIVIAHRLSTVRRADRIVVLEDGRVKETGRHDELIARRGVYWRLHSIQFSDVKVENAR